MMPDVKEHKKTRSFSPLIFQTDTTKDIEHTQNLTSQKTTRSNGFFHHLEDNMDRKNSPNEPQKYMKSSFIKKNKVGFFSSASQYPVFNNEPEISNIKPTQNSSSLQNKLRKFLQSFPSQIINKNADSNEAVTYEKNVKKFLNLTSKNALNPQMASSTLPEFCNPQKSLYYNLSYARRKESSGYKEKHKQLGKSKLSNSKVNPMRKGQSKDIKQGNKEKSKKKKLHDKPKIIEKGAIKKNNTIQTQENYEQQGSINKQQRFKKSMENILEQQNRKLRILKEKPQESTTQNKQLQQQNIKLQQQLKAYQQVALIKSSLSLELSSKHQQQQVISNLVQLVQALVNSMHEKQAKDEMELQAQIIRNKQLQVVIANLQQNKERYFFEFRKEYTQLANRLKERESIIQQLQTSNHFLREQYAQLHLNMKKISQERARHINQQLEQQSFSCQQTRIQYKSSIR